MARPTRVIIDGDALLNNLALIKNTAPKQKIIAMVKANAYGCGLSFVAPLLENKVHGFGVACLSEAMTIIDLGCQTPCILFQGVFSPDEWHVVAEHDFHCVVHHQQQLEWLVNTPLKKPVKIWLKINTGMNRLGFLPDRVEDVIKQLSVCKWVEQPIHLMSHLACADQPEHPMNLEQKQTFDTITQHFVQCQRSLANSAAIFALPNTHYEMIRPGLALYGVSPFAHRTAVDLGLRPVMSFNSAISALYTLNAGVGIGYDLSFTTQRKTLIGIVPVGYGDGYPRHIASSTQVWIKGQLAPIIGRVSMDMMSIDLSDIAGVKQGDAVELWGANLAVETIAKAAKTSPYELICQISDRARGDHPYTQKLV